jgi:Carboxypeptidase regulatory-like domain
LAPNLAYCLRQAPVRAGVLGLVLCLAAGTVSLGASTQAVTATTGAVNGIVTDSTTALVPGVTVSLSGPLLMAARTTITDEQGVYRFSAVPTGDHILTFELAGFTTLVHEGIHVGLGFTATVSESWPLCVEARRRLSIP